MKTMNSSRFPIRPSRIILSVLVGIAALSATPSHADIVWSQDFTGHADNTAPTQDFTSNSTNDWFSLGNEAMFRVNTSVGSPAPSLVFNDNSTAVSGGLGNLRLAMNEFSTFSTSASAPIFRLSFDWKVDTFLSGLTSEAFRLILRANGSTGLGDQLILGFNRASLNDGDGSTTDLAWYADAVGGTSNFAPSNTNAIGLIAGSGWEPGFNFGEYDFGDGTANDSDDLFYHFDLGYDYLTGAVNGTVTRIAPDATNGQSAAFTVAMNPNLVFSNTDASDVILIASTNGVTGVSQFDNFVVESIPEPASGAAVLLGVMTLAGRRRRTVKE